ncbi:hypothetical protein MSG28_002061 [Choristoneura fumiferana]|uniref:Uncharacterized protein n=1 Tax=Choristoneura fumiferana TaxID=7141 RepID=A0ACC0JTT0_CHOFU|nr:hypothetical protein MSG28_002061 [Choristoneura fumiferana]
MYIKLLFSCILCWQLQIVTSKYESCKHTTCHECITDPMGCAWCSSDGLHLDQRCKLTSSIPDDWCPGYKENRTSEKNVTEDRDFTSILEDGIQIRPQKIELKLRVGEVMEFQFSYKAAKDYPIDMYFLHDASESMKDVLKNFNIKSQEIYSAMKNLTKNVYFGLGFFIDKKVVPTNDILNKSDKPCYSFQHKLKLTDKLDKFNETLEEVKLGYNYDFPEGGLDGLAQAMVCKEQIAWRNTSRKMIIYITDASVHTAGDGKLSGINDPYDGGCYLNEEGVYFKEKEMDYPSTGMISKLAADEQYTTLFVATKPEALEHYETMSGIISGAHKVEYDKDKMSEKLSEIYKQISDNLQLDVNLGAKDKEYFDIKFDPDCTDKKNCAVVIGEEKHIKGTIRLRKYTKNYYKGDHIEIPIVQRGLKENLLLVVDIISSCACEDKSRTVPTSPACSFAGDKQCGICKCSEGRTGPICLCAENNNSNSTGKESCIKDHVECSNNGKCVCDECLCQPGFGGIYCEYRNNDCKRDHTGALCSDHGVCRDGVCYCDTERTGEMCECVISDSSCRDANSNICNNRGHCECGRCKCDSLPTWDVRGYQDEFCSQHTLACDNCHDMQCRALTGCIACHSSNATDCSTECDEGITFVNASTVTEDTKSKWNLCAKYHHRVMSGCYSNFSYIYDDAPRGIVLFVLSEPDCMESYYIYGSMSLMILVMIGLASLLGWKLMTEARDREEYNAFLEKAREENEEVLNECYTAPTTTFRNPMFKRSFR